MSAEHHQPHEEREQQAGQPPQPPGQPGTREAGGGYTCPMHPEVRQDRPGNCPRCGMQLVPRQPEHAEQQHGEQHDPVEMIRQMRRPWLWTNFTVITLGFWLMTSPFTFGYLNEGLVASEALRVTAERGLPPVAARAAAMAWSDVISGLLLVLFGALSVIPRFDFIGRWSACLVGLWLQAAPLFLWAPAPAALLNDTLVGALVIAFTVLAPMMPGMAHHMAMMKPGPEMPPGWSYNPSSWLQRAPLIATGFIGWFISRYLAAFQLGHIDTAWDPFFGAGTMTVLKSKVSEMWPVSDGGLGALAYTIEALMAYMGATNRWRTMPWMVTFFGILVIPLGLVHIFLVISMPVQVGYWCTLCLAAAAVMLVMIPLTVDEVVAMCQFMARSVREGKPFWRTFFVGDTIEGEVNEDTRTPDYGAPPRRLLPPMVWGVTAPWSLVASAAIGVWLLFAPSVFGTEGALANSDRLAGPLAFVVAVIAMAEVVRAGRFLNVLIGAWLVAAPWVLGGASTAAHLNGVVAGLLLIGLSLPLGMIHERYGNWDRFVRWPSRGERGGVPHPRRQRGRVA